MGGCLKKQESSPIPKTIENEPKSGMMLQFKSKDLRITDIYSLKKVIGQGGFGVVRRGVRLDNPSIQVAIKTINKSRIKDNLELLINEVSILSATDHPNIVKLYEYFNEQYFFIIVTEYCSGGELFDRIVKNGRITESEVRKYMKIMMRAVNHLHKLGICHRDIKPQNFIFENESSEAELKLIDFGLAHRFQDKHHKTVPMDAFVGTSYYIAPEVIKGLYDTKCDIWSLGIIMVLMLTGTHPFSGSQSSEVYNCIVNQEIDENSHEYKHISPSGRDLIKKLLAKNPSLRLSAEQALAHPWMKEAKSEKADINIIKSLQYYEPPSQMWRAAIGILVKYMNVEEIKALKIAFDELDTNGTGLLTFNDIKTALKNCGADLPNKKIVKIFKKLDYANDGTIHYTEFLAATVSTRLHLDEQMIWTLFNCFDIDKSGEITLENLKVVFKRMGLVFSDEKILNIIKEVDFDHTGAISFDEFKSMINQKALFV
jgi:calcium-dependent protein kinase